MEKDTMIRHALVYLNKAIDHLREADESGYADDLADIAEEIDDEIE